MPLLLTGTRRDVYYLNSSEHMPLNSVNVINVSNAIFNLPEVHKCVPGALSPRLVPG